MEVMSAKWKTNASSFGIDIEPSIAWIGFGSAYTVAQHKSHAQLIAAAPDLLEALENLENDDGSIPEHAWNLCQSAISKAKGIKP